MNELDLVDAPVQSAAEPSFNFTPVEGSPPRADSGLASAGVSICKCGKQFSGHKNRTYCTEKCRRRFEYGRLRGFANYVEKECCICGALFNPREQKSKTCSSVCAYELLKLRSKKNGSKRTKFLQSLIKHRQCKFCGMDFVPKDRKKDWSFCSSNCNQDYWNYRRRLPVKVNSCVICGSKFHTAKNNSAKCCSKKCRHKHARNLSKTRNTQSSLQIKIGNALRGRIAQAMRGQGLKKSNATMELCGCDMSELKAHLEKQFTAGMSWENWSYRGWHIDHIVPCAWFDLSDPVQRKYCFHYSNLQPMWAVENQKKNSRLN